MTKLEAQTQQFTTALHRLQEVLTLPMNDVVRDSAIQRFEFTLDLAWKTLNTFLEEKKGWFARLPKNALEKHTVKE